MALRLPKIKVTRDGIWFLIGAGGIIHETWLRTGPERPSLLVLFAAMVGLPAVLGQDRKRREKRDDTTNGDAK